VTEETKRLEMHIEDAVKLHGHLGPFLIIGVRMGEIAKRILTPENHQHADMKVSIQLHLHTPFSCILDGIQSMTHCTIGNQRLKAKESKRRIIARFETEDPDKTLTITVKPEAVKEVTDRISKGAANGTLADVIASTPEGQLFQFNTARKHRQAKP
jgi:formylmethanofuran dehydrogenase subunit E